MTSSVLTALAVAFGLSSPVAPDADLPTSFKTINATTKGPFGKNVLQGTSSRTTVLGSTPPGFLFQSAYRNDVARSMVDGYGFYLGNLFATNYYELMGEFVFGGYSTNHALDHAGLVAAGAKAMPRAAQMVRGWVLEKSYIEQFPGTRLATSFKVRGISSVEAELEYSKYFLNFYLTAMDDDFQYLPAFLLAVRSPIMDSTSLARARDLVARAYDDVATMLGSQSPMARDLYRIRNAVHNQLTPAIIGEIDSFLRKYPEYRSMGYPAPAPSPTAVPAPALLSVASLPGEEPSDPDRRDLDEVRKILADYYAYSAAKLSKQAGSIGLTGVKAAADQITRSGVNKDTLLALSNAAAAVRQELSGSGLVPYEKRGIALALLANASRYLSKELSKLTKVAEPAVAQAVLNCIYIEGFLIRDNWQYFQRDLASSPNLGASLRKVIEVSSGSWLKEAFSPTYDQWLTIEPRMQYFYDNTIKSSAIDVAAGIAQKMP
jgi:hypothetical protein